MNDDFSIVRVLVDLMRMDLRDSVPDTKSFRIGHFDDISLREVDIDLFDSYLEK